MLAAWLGRCASDAFASHVLPQSCLCYINGVFIFFLHVHGARCLVAQVPGEKYVRFDSLVDRVNDPTIFVVQDGHQAYPAYLITYH